MNRSTKHLFQTGAFLAFWVFAPHVARAYEIDSCIRAYNRCIDYHLDVAARCDNLCNVRSNCSEPEIHLDRQCYIDCANRYREGAADCEKKLQKCLTPSQAPIPAVPPAVPRE